MKMLCKIRAKKGTAAQIYREYDAKAIWQKNCQKLLPLINGKRDKFRIFRFWKFEFRALWFTSWQVSFTAQWLRVELETPTFVTSNHFIRCLVTLNFVRFILLLIVELLSLILSHLFNFLGGFYVINCRRKKNL